MKRSSWIVPAVAISLFVPQVASAAVPVDSSTPTETSVPVEAPAVTASTAAPATDAPLDPTLPPTPAAEVSPAATSEYVVLYEPGTNVAAETRELVVDDVDVTEVFTEVVPAVTVDVTAAEAIEIAQDPNVLAVEPNRMFSVAATQSSPPWNLDRIDQPNLPLNSSFVYPDTAGEGVDVYIVDTGIYGWHVDFANRMASGFTTVYDGWGTSDCNGHGTHVASTAAGTTWGVAKKATLIPVRVLGCGGGGYLSDVVAGLNWIASQASGPSVVNMSLGAGGQSETIDAAINNLVASGVTVVVAAGNEDDNACAYTPSSSPQAVTVAATTSSDARAGFSNYGSCVDIFAPGQGIEAAFPYSATATDVLSGTSMASPHVAGVVALILGANPTATPAQIVQSLTSSASTGLVSNAGTNSPNRLLVVPTESLPPPPPPPPPPPTPPASFGKTYPASSGATVSQSRVTLTWNASAGADWYDVCFGTSSRCSSWVRVTDTSYLTPVLRNNGRYYWQVRAGNSVGTILADGGSTWSMRVSLPSLSARSPRPQRAMTNFALTLSARGGVQPYTWSSTTLPDGLTLVGNAIRGVPTVYGTFPVTVTLTDAGGGTASTTVSLRFTPPLPGVFSKSEPITAATTVDGQTFTLEWDASPYADRYEVCLSTSSRCRSWTAASSTSYTTPALRANTRYYWQVRAVNASGRTDAAGGVSSFVTPS